MTPDESFAATTAELQASLDDALTRIDADAELLKEIDDALGFAADVPVQQWDRLDRVKALVADGVLLDWFDVAVGERCGWMLDQRGIPKLKHWSQEPDYSDIREAIDAAMKADDA